MSNQSVATLFHDGSAVLDLMPLNARELQTANGILVFICSSVLNVMLMVVLATERNSMLRPYSNILMINCICDLIYTCMSLITDLQVEYTNGHFAVSLKGIYSHLSMQWQYIGVVTWVSSLYLSIFVIPLVFYFRYCLVVKNKQLRVPQLMKYSILPLGTSIAIAISIMMGFLKDKRRKTCEQALWHPLWTYNGASIEKCLIAEPSNPYVIVYIVAMGVTNLGMYALMIYFTYGIFNTLKMTQKSMGAKTLRLQKQMNVLLIIQLLMPVFCACLPLSITVLFTFLNFTVSGLAIAVIIFLEWIPLVNPLITILFVTNYRRRVIRYLCIPIRFIYMNKSRMVSEAESASHHGGTAPTTVATIAGGSPAIAGRSFATVAPANADLHISPLVVI